MIRKHYLLLILLAIICTPKAMADDSWRDNVKDLIYSPRYFGPSAFPFPELRSGICPSRFEVEVRGQYHYYTGDKTKDFFVRALVPFVKGRAGVEVSCLVKEDYKLTPETRDERHAVETESPISYNGDIVVSAFFQLLKSEKWVDAMLNMTLKTASGSRVCDARFTDAAAYWFDLTVGKTLLKNASETASLRMQALIGFYCWTTNKIEHRQNDALSYGAGFTGTYRNFSLTTDLSGFYGYENNGDRPLIIRNNLRYEYKKNIISLRYNHGMKDYLYDNYSIGYIRCF
ncbi:hypothetical protein M2459_000811 [Parabacteroides sp. PF5-5]|uniref:hypothetical protein n=1 Tax=unclassified Parabacteroides TaxID=2649774 RepID=UPI0024757E04|nr:MULTISPECIES: hypothetical protein [unclassified Parabacteroides]MDH6304099.1 hypothetical protein [Parabacteroides sp. PH5-39]MDH6315201.1 hypothetical protein [Parabacteroides sp. PF5-13]MDH6318846.1 hypothetical protein [Parabacteroides sp. PH5-13]MDH6322575.1 hypothetical protein [Parabacteroides sp. PH5-8]MDH6326273.1 hypothetical protein [Parabacteroides sp. PH5-41]